jgi:hypothetical protein
MLVLAAVLLLCVYSWLNLHWWQQELQQKLKQFDVSTATNSQNTAQDNALIISDIALPQTPKRAKPVLATSSQPAVSSAVTELQNPAASTTKLVLKSTEKPNIKTPPQEAKTETRAEPKQQQSAKQIYEQLQGDNALDVQIALPTNPAKQQRLFDYLYRCAGVQFAVLQQQQLSYLSPQRYVPVSQWLRVANGPLSTQEQQWLGQQHGTPIRLFPQAIDQRLAQYIATNLGGSKLSSLRASYELTASGLVLTNIQLNAHKTQGTWLLHHSQCTA